MRVKILGSCAAEGWPALFCECDACREARRRGGRNIRRRTVYALDEDVLVDFGPDIYWQSTEFGIDLAAIRHIVVTHSHVDHLSPRELHWRRKGFSQVNSPLTIYGNGHVLRRVREESGMTEHDLNLDLVELAPGRAFEAGAFRVMPLRAQHAEADEQALNYIFERDDRALLIANDTGWWEEDTWEAVRGFRLDAAIIDSTYGMRYPDHQGGHLGVAAVVAVRDRLAELGVLKEGAQVVANHFSHNGGGLYEDLCEWFSPHGIAVGYDGMELTV
jgi:phosphoribosyl 1,2-cyclic phosphate phosphodiesterase